MESLQFNDLLTLIAFLASGLAARPLVKFFNSLEWFVALASRRKVALVIGANALITVGAMAIQQLVPSQALNDANPWVKSAIAAAQMAWVIYNNQDAYQSLKETARAALPEVK